MSLTLPPPAPSISNPSSFEERADARMAWQDVNVAEMNALLPGLDSLASSAAQSAAVAAGAVSEIGVTVWVRDAIYTIGECKFSPENFQTYRRRTDGAGTLDPSVDPTNWAARVAGEVTLSGAETLTNKRISAFYFLDRTYKNTSATGAIALDVSIASVFNLTLAGPVTLSIANAPALSSEEQGFVVRVKQGATAYPVTWFSGAEWLTVGGVAPAAPAANKTIEYLFTTPAAGAYEGRKGAAT